jgi:hypothetical protein
MGYMYYLALGLFEAGSLILYLLLKARIKNKITPENCKNCKTQYNPRHHSMYSISIAKIILF